VDVVEDKDGFAAARGAGGVVSEARGAGGGVVDVEAHVKSNVSLKNELYQVHAKLKVSSMCDEA
jgi:hypothetical protein